MIVRSSVLKGKMSGKTIKVMLSNKTLCKPYMWQRGCTRWMKTDEQNTNNLYESVAI